MSSFNWLSVCGEWAGKDRDTRWGGARDPGGALALSTCPDANVHASVYRKMNEVLSEYKRASHPIRFCWFVCCVVVVYACCVSVTERVFVDGGVPLDDVLPVCVRRRRLKRKALAGAEDCHSRSQLIYCEIQFQFNTRPNFFPMRMWK